MKNALMLFVLIVLFSITINAQSESCCSNKETKTTIEKSSKQDQTNIDNNNNSTSTALTKNTLKSGSEMEKTEVENKMEHKTSDCCDGKKVKDMKHKESEEKEKSIQ